MKLIGVWGDSITWGGYDHQVGGWVLRLRRHCDNNYQYSSTYEGGPSVYNLGIWGDKVEDVLQRFESEFNARKPDVVVLAVGINDSPHQSYPEGTPVDKFETAFRELVSKAKLKAQKILVVGPTNVIDNHPRNRGYKNDSISPYVRCIQKMTQELDVQLIDLFGLMDDDDLTMDGVHPLESGHEKIYQKVKEAIS